MRFITWGVGLLAATAFASRTYRKDPCDFIDFKTERAPQLTLENTPNIAYPWFGPIRENSHAHQWPHIYGEIESRLAGFHTRNNLLRDAGTDVRSGKLKPIEAFDQMAVLFEGELRALKTLANNIHRQNSLKNRSEKSASRILRSVLHNLAFKHSCSVEVDEFHERAPWYIEVHRKHFAELRVKAGRIPDGPLTNDDFNVITEFGKMLPSVLAEAHAAMLLPDIRYASIHGEELDNLKLLKRPLSPELKHSEIDLIGEEKKGFVLYEIKRYQERKVGEEKDFNDTLNQMLRLKQIAASMRLSTTVKLVSYSGFTTEARLILEQHGIELIGPP